MIEIAANLSAVLLTIPALLFTVECLLGVRPLSAEKSLPAPSFAVLVPAHNEASGIMQCVTRLRRDLRRHDRLIVVADNCTDDTASLARAGGASVIERFEPGRGGKGHALSFGRRALEANPPEVVIVIDADCWTSAEALKLLASQAASHGTIVQAHYLFESRAETNALIKLSNFALLIKNKVRQRGLRRLGAPAILQGSGMAFPWRAFVDARLDTESIAEDLEIGLDLVKRGWAVSWAEQAEVWSKPAGRGATLTQRRRWEHGFISTAVVHVPGLLRSAWARRHAGTALLALDLLVPPVALLMLVLVLALAAFIFLYIMSGAVGPALISGSGVLCILMSVGLVWSIVGRIELPFGILMRAPIYLAWKLPIYVRLIRGRQREWVRTSRDD